MAIRKVRIDGDPILRKRSRALESITDRERELFDDMIETMHDADGIGIAAPQVGILKRMIVIDIGEGPIKVANPVLRDYEGEEILYEGCLSIPQFSGAVKRPHALTVDYMDENGEEKTMHATGLLARVFCHETDHLDGILFKDVTLREDEIPEELREQHERELQGE